MQKLTASATILSLGALCAIPALFMTAHKTQAGISPPAPVIHSVSGCLDVGNVTQGCPSGAPIQIVVHGENFNAYSIVLVGGVPPEDLWVIDSSTLSFTLPPGNGSVPLTVISNGLLTMLPNAITYTPCRGDSNGDGVVDFDDITTSLAHWGVSCE